MTCQSTRNVIDPNRDGVVLRFWFEWFVVNNGDLYLSSTLTFLKRAHQIRVRV